MATARLIGNYLTGHRHRCREDGTRWRELWNQQRSSAVAGRFEPWSLYRLKSTGSRCQIVSFGEGQDGRVTLTVSITGAVNFTMFDRNVFGIDPDDLEPCDPPTDDELLGAMLTGEQVDENTDTLRLMVRPDIWVDDGNGKAVKRTA